jgi:hypothetical protein
MPTLHTLASALAAAAMAVWIGWIVIADGGQVQSAEVGNVVTTAQAIARAGATVIPSERALAVEPAGYR